LRRLVQQPRELVHTLQAPKRFEHLCARLGLALPRDAGEELLRDALTCTVTVVDGAAVLPACAQLVVDAAAVVRLQVPARHVRGLVEAKPFAPIERQADAAQALATRAIGVQSAPVIHL
jgi:hypothetical protein